MARLTLILTWFLVTLSLAISPADAKKASTAETTLWKTIETSDATEDFQGYLDTYPNGAFSEQARTRIAEIEAANAIVEKGWLGAEIADLNRATANVMNWPDYKGVIVISIVEGSAADGALEVGDLILNMDETPTKTMIELVTPVSQQAPNAKVNFRVIRKGEEMTIPVTLGGFHDINSRLAEAGDGPALYRLGNAYRVGHGVTPNPNKAYTLFQEAWTAGSGDGGYMAARALVEGNGVAEDAMAGVALMNEVADTGHALGNADAAYFLMAGTGGETDLVAARAYIDKAIKSRSAYAHYLLSQLYDGSYGSTEVDADKSLENLLTAARLGNIAAVEDLDDRGVEVFSLLDAQERLAVLGLYDGRADGLTGPKTRGAIRAFQALIGVQETGVLDDAVGRRLYAVTSGRNWVISKDGKKTRRTE